MENATLYCQVVKGENVSSFKSFSFSFSFFSFVLTGPTSIAVQRMMSSSVGWMSHHSSLFFRSSDSSWTQVGGGAGEGQDDTDVTIRFHEKIRNVTSNSSDVRVCEYIPILLPPSEEETQTRGHNSNTV